MSAARKIQRRNKGALQQHAQVLDRALTELQSLEGLAGLATLPNKVDELRGLVEALVDDYEGVARRQRLLFEALDDLVSQREEFSHADRALSLLRQEFAAMKSDEG